MRGAERFLKGAVFIAALGSAAGAHAGTAGAFSVPDIPVVAISPQVTYSKPASGKDPALQTYVAFKVGDPDGFLVQNISGNAVNNVKITLTVTGKDVLEKFVLFRPADYLPSGCSYSATLYANPYVLTCTVKQLKNGEGFKGFYLFFVAPEKVGGGDGDEPGSDTIDTKLEVAYSEQANGPGKVEPNSVITPIEQTAVVTLGTDDPVNIKSAVPKNGGTFFTGSGAPTSIFDPISTTVTVPPTATVVQGQIFEAKPSSRNCLNNFKECYYSEISVPGTFTSSPYFQVIFRISPENFSTTALKIESVTLYYRDSADATAKIVEPCSPADQPWLEGTANYGTPCWSTRQQYRKNYRQNPALSEVMEWVLLNTKNGFLEFE